MILWVFLFLLSLLLLISTQTLCLHPRPRKTILKEPYTLYEDVYLKKKGNKKLVVALHGMYASPEVFREFGQEIAQEGWDLYAPVLPNSALSAEDLQTQEIYQWEESLQVAFQRVFLHAEGYTSIVLLGHSQGGALTLALTPSLPFLKAALVVAAPIHLQHPESSLFKKITLSLSGFLCLFIPGLKVDQLSDEKHQQLSKVEDTRGGEGFFYGLTLHSMILGLRKVRKNLNRISLPLFLAYEKNDRTVGFKDFFEIQSRVASSNIHTCYTETPKDLHPYSKKHRLFSYKPVKETLIRSLQTFLREIV